MWMFMLTVAGAAELLVLENSGTLGAFDTETEEVSARGATGVVSVWGDIAHDWESGTTFLVAPMGPTLYRLDRHTGSATAIGDTGLENLRSLVVDPETGDLVTLAGHGPHALYALDPDTAAATWLMDVGGDAEDLGWDPISGELVLRDAWYGDLFGIDRSTGALRFLAVGGAFGSGAAGLALDPDSGAMYSFNESSSVHRYDPADEWSGLWLGTFDAGPWAGATTDGDPRGGPLLTVAGACPGRVQVRGEHLSPDGWVVVIAGTGSGSAPVGGGACAGLDTGLDTASVLAWVRADGDGRIDAHPRVPDGACGRWLRLVDVERCARSDVRRL